MKITKEQLRRIIKEEIQRVLNEEECCKTFPNFPNIEQAYHNYEYARSDEEQVEAAQKFIDEYGDVKKQGVFQPSPCQQETYTDVLDFLDNFDYSSLY